MTSTIKFNRSASNTPTSLDYGIPSLSLTGGRNKLFVGNSSNSAVELTVASNIGNTPAGGIAATTVQAAIDELDSEKQATLVSGTNIKTINSTSILGSGDIVISGGGKVVQVVNTQTGAVATGTTTIPNDDTIPQNTEGVQFMTLAITPTNSNNKLKIDVVFCWSSNTNATNAVALFQDSTASAIAATQCFPSPSFSVVAPAVFSHYMTAGTTSATTFKVRAGQDIGHTLTFNGVGGARKLGGVMASSITITEIAV